jgi:hypothetical protein
VILALIDVFHFSCEIKYGVISAILQYIVRAEEAAKYKYIVELFNDAPSEYLALSHWCRRNLDVLEESASFLESAWKYILTTLKIFQTMRVNRHFIYGNN